MQKSLTVFENSFILEVYLRDSPKFASDWEIHFINTKIKTTYINYVHKLHRLNYIKYTDILVFVKYALRIQQTLTTLSWKTPIFQSKEAMNKKHNISLNSEFTVVLNGVICFSVRFCNNLLLMLKVCFQVFSFASKKV